MQNFLKAVDSFFSNDIAKNTAHSVEGKSVPVPLDPSLLVAVGGGWVTAPKNGW